MLFVLRNLLGPTSWPVILSRPLACRYVNRALRSSLHADVVRSICRWQWVLHVDILARLMRPKLDKVKTMSD